MDETLPLYMDLLLKIFISLIVSLAAVVFVAGWRTLVLGAFITLAGAGWGSIYLRAQLCVKRENSNAKSPGAYLLFFIFYATTLMLECGAVLSHFHAAIGGTSRCSWLI